MKAGTTTGEITIYNNSAGTVNGTLVPEGYFVPEATTGGLYYMPTPASPTLWNNSVDANTLSTSILVAGIASIPSSGVGAVALSVQCDYSSATASDGWLWVAGEGTTPPSPLSQSPSPEEVQCVPGEKKVGLVYSPVSNGHIEIYNGGSMSAGVTMWVEGYFSSTGGDAFHPMDPVPIRTISSLSSTNQCPAAGFSYYLPDGSRSSNASAYSLPWVGTMVDPFICASTYQFLPFGEGTVVDAQMVVSSRDEDESITGDWVGMGQSLGSASGMPVIDYAPNGNAAGNDNEVLVPDNANGPEGTYDNGPGSTMGLVLVYNHDAKSGDAGAISYAVDVTGWWDPAT